MDVISASLSYETCVFRNLFKWIYIDTWKMYVNLQKHIILHVLTKGGGGAQDIIQS